MCVSFCDALKYNTQDRTTTKASKKVIVYRLAVLCRLCLLRALFTFFLICFSRAFWACFSCALRICSAVFSRFSFIGLF